MLNKIFVLLLLLILSVQLSFGQTCTTLGQNPSTAFPVCGTASFSMNNVPICGNRQVPNKYCTAQLTDKNPFWYKFTCFTSGTLGFSITPNQITDDYDWQIFDVTNRNPSDLYTDASMIVSSNWSGESGVTGASAAGSNVFVCDNLGKPLFSAMPTLIQGHEYLLLVSHFSDNQSGYSLSFGGGTASITDPTEPHLQNARAICDGITMAVKLNKKMKCSSLDAAGGEFTITPSFAQVINATGVGCSNSFDLDSLVLTFNAAVPPGNYKISVKKNPTGSKLVDLCDRVIPETDTIPVTVYPVTFEPMDSISKVSCTPSALQLVFKKPILCNTIEPGGTDFTITGPSTVTITLAAGTCNNSASTNVIDLQLGSPIKVGGIYTVTLKTGSDGNTIKNECGMETPAGSFVKLTAYDTVSAAFTENIQYSCTADVVNFVHSGSNGVNSWLWKLDDGNTSTKQNPQITYTIFNEKTIQLKVTNGVCSDSSTVKISLDNYIKAAFECTEMVCPTDEAVFKDNSAGSIISWKWDFGNGVTSNQQAPANLKYPAPDKNTEYQVILIVANDKNCADTATKTITVFNSCNIAVASAFTPNHDGLNDYLYPINAYKARNLTFKVYNRLGQVIFETNDWTKKWDGTLNGRPQDPGTYVWYLQYIHADTGQKYSMRGSTVLIR